MISNDQPLALAMSFQVLNFFGASSLAGEASSFDCQHSSKTLLKDQILPHGEFQVLSRRLCRILRSVLSVAHEPAMKKAQMPEVL